MKSLSFIQTAFLFLAAVFVFLFVLYAGNNRYQPYYYGRNQNAILDSRTGDVITIDLKSDAILTVNAANGKVTIKRLSEAKVIGKFEETDQAQSSAPR